MMQEEKAIIYAYKCTACFIISGVCTVNWWESEDILPRPEINWIRDE